MKKIIIFFIVILALSVTASAEYLYDNEGLLTQSEAEEIETLLEKAVEKADMPIIIVTSDSYGYDIKSFAEECVRKYNDAALLVASDANDEWYLHTVGRADDIYDIDALLEQILPYRQSGDYYTAFKTFAKECHEGAKLPLMRILIPIILGLVIGLITVSIMKSSLKTVRYKSGAEDYVKSGSLNITASHDRFLWKNITRVRRQNNNSSGGRSGSPSRGSGRKF